MNTGVAAVRALAIARSAGAAVLLVRPEAVGAAVSGRHSIPAAWIVRTLGARQLAQAAVEIRWPVRRTVAAGAAVDLTHALSMLGVATVARSYRRAAFASAAAASASAAFGAVASHALQ